MPLEDVTPEFAVKHPNWKMGPKISVDSATLMNKGLELIEAYYWFDVPEKDIEVWVHPQSIVHGAIWLVDNTCLALLSKPDMRSSIGFALEYPTRLHGVIPKLELSQMASLEFSPPNEVRFPALRLAREALKAGPSHLILLNAVNEVAVHAFLTGKLLFTGIAEVLEGALGAHSTQPINSVDDVMAMDEKARREGLAFIERLGL